MMVRVSEGRGSDSGSTEGGIVTGARTDNKSKAVVNSPRARLSISTKRISTSSLTWEGELTLVVPLISSVILSLLQVILCPRLHRLIYP